MKEIGLLLKEKRESANVSLEEVSVATKISVRHLQAIEEGDESKLPAKTFVRGFVQSYAKYLGLNPSEVMERFHSVMGPTNAKAKVSSEETTKLTQHEVASGGKIISGIVIVVALAVILILHRVLSEKEEEMRGQDVSAITGSDVPLNIPSTPPPQSTPMVNSTPLVEVTPPKIENAVATPVPSATPTLIVAPSATPLVSPTPQVVAKDSPKPKKPQATPVPTPTAQPIVQATPGEELDAGPQEIVVEALDTVGITVAIDGKSAQEVRMSPDQILTFKAKKKMKLDTENGGAISIIHNGFEIGVPGNLGQPKSMVFPR